MPLPDEISSPIPSRNHHRFETYARFNPSKHGFPFCSNRKLLFVQTKLRHRFDTCLTHWKFGRQSLADPAGGQRDCAAAALLHHAAAVAEDGGYAGGRRGGIEISKLAKTPQTT
jgi:hypothetical protein